MHTLNIGKMIKQAGHLTDCGGHELNQDCYYKMRPWKGQKDTAFVAVYDGHGDKGDTLAMFARDTLPKFLEEADKRGDDPSAALKYAFDCTHTEIEVSSSACRR